jgi:hypothetical protein
VAEVNYSYVQIGHAILRPHPITGAVQRGNSVTHSVADATRNWRFDSGRPAGLNNLRRAACKVSPAELGLAWLTLRHPLTDPCLIR